jgi:serine protease Do
MSDPPEICPACRSAVAPEASACHACGASLLVDVGLASAVGDARLRYQAARSLSALGAPLPPFVDLQRALAAPRPVVARGVTRAVAASARSVAQTHGLSLLATSASSASAPGTGRRGDRRGLVMLAVGLTLGGVAVAVFSGKRQRGPAGRPPEKSAAPAVDSATRPRSALSTQEIARRALPSTVTIRCSRSEGAGFFVAPDLLLTNAHVVCPTRDSLRVHLSDGRSAPGIALESDPVLDLALVRVQGYEGAPLPLGDAGVLEVGDRVVMIGNPIGYGFTVHEAKVSSLQRGLLGVAYIQIDGRINPGNSGGPLIDDEGRVVGVVSLKDTEGEGIGFALPINYAYSGSVRVPVAPAGAESSEGFAAMRDHAEREDQTKAQDFAGLATQPGLVGVMGGAAAGELQAVVVLPSHGDPGRALEMTFHLWSGGRIVCSMKSDVSDWRPLDDRLVLAEIDPRAIQWMDKHQLRRHFYLGRAPLWVRVRCPVDQLARASSIEIELEGAMPEASRVRLR